MNARSIRFSGDKGSAMIFTASEFDGSAFAEKDSFP
jgi:hypothetical protein